MARKTNRDISANNSIATTVGGGGSFVPKGFSTGNQALDFISAALAGGGGASPFGFELSRIFRELQSKKKIDEGKMKRETEAKRQQLLAQGIDPLTGERHGTLHGRTPTPDPQRAMHALQLAQWLKNTPGSNMAGASPDLRFSLEAAAAMGLAQQSIDPRAVPGLRGESAPGLAKARFEAAQAGANALGAITSKAAFERQLREDFHDQFAKPIVG